MKHFISGAALLLAMLPLAVSAQANTVVLQQPTESTIVVTGEGLVSKSPDEAKISVQIVTDDSDAANSSSKDNTIYNALKSRLAALPLAGDALRTTGYDVEFIPYPPKNLPPEERQPRYGYVTTRSLSITVSPLELAGKVIDAATAAGVTSVGDVTFDLKDQRVVYAAALAAATADAKRDAEAIASAAGVRLVRVRSITTEYNVAPVAAPLMMRAQAAMAPPPAPPTQIDNGGPIDVTARVTLTYAIN
jgi:uncharacterized protein YggE